MCELCMCVAMEHFPGCPYEPEDAYEDEQYEEEWEEDQDD